MFWLLRGTGSPYFIGPGTPKDRAQILQASFRKAYDDPEFEKEYKKTIGDDPLPINPEDYQIAIRENPARPGNYRTVQEVFRRRSASQPIALSARKTTRDDSLLPVGKDMKRMRSTPTNVGSRGLTSETEARSHL